jgi:hypothetical protein
VKKTVAIILMLVFSSLLIPVQQLGNMLSNNQLNEELPHNDDGNANDPGKRWININEYISPITQTSLIQFCINKQFIYFSELVPNNHSYEVLVPPPNSFN